MNKFNKSNKYNYIVQSYSLKGLRDKNEDAIFNFNNINNIDNTNNKIYGVFDGHGGDIISNFLKDIIYKLFINNLFSNNNRKTINRNIKKIYDEI
jgi:serine/threonine protein phosphatase PrpC